MFAVDIKLVLFSNNLVFGPVDSLPQGCIAINSTSVVQPCAVDGKKHAFRLLKQSSAKLPEEELLVVSCGDARTCADWVEALTLVSDPSSCSMKRQRSKGDSKPGRKPGRPGLPRQASSFQEHHDEGPEPEQEPLVPVQPEDSAVQGPRTTVPDVAPTETEEERRARLNAQKAELDRRKAEKEAKEAGGAGPAQADVAPPKAPEPEKKSGFFMSKFFGGGKNPKTPAPPPAPAPDPVAPTPSVPNPGPPPSPIDPAVPPAPAPGPAPSPNTGPDAAPNPGPVPGPDAAPVPAPGGIPPVGPTPAPGPVPRNPFSREILAAVEKPLLVEKKTSTEPRYAKRFIRIDVKRKEFQWAKSFSDFGSLAHKSVSISRICKGARMSELIRGPNLSLEFNEMAVLPKDVWTKSFFHPIPPKSLDIKFAHSTDGNNALEAYLVVIEALAC